GARFVVFGQFRGGGRDSVRVRAAVLDARKDRTLADIDRSEEAGRIDRLADSLSVDVIRALTPTTSGVHVRLYSVGTKSLPALKAFLQGERFFRHFSLDSAIAGYDRAVALDTTFALALDSAFAPAYIHPVEIALNDNDGGAALRYVRGYLAVSSVIPEAAGMHLLSMVLDPQRSASQDFNRELARASRPALYHVALAVQSWPDADETQIQVARQAAATAQARLAGAPADTGDDVRVYLALLPN